MYCIGESLLDIIFENNQPKFATPGGSMLNSAVSLGRTGVSVHLISDYANDATGMLIDDFLEQNGVSTMYVNRYNNGKTTLALAFLDQDHNADYTFYKDYPANRFPLQLPDIHQDDIILFGSFYSISEGLHHEILSFITKAREKGAFIIYDPNFRKPHLADLERLKPWILENIRKAHMVRGSNEDFELIFGTGNIDQTYSEISANGCNMLIYTKNKEGAEAIFGNGRFTVKVPEIKPVSTIGAGDAFNAGLIYGLVTKSALHQSLKDADRLLQMAARFSADVCLHIENYVSNNFGNSIQKESGIQ